MEKSSAGRWLSLGQAASMLGVDQATLRHWADTGRVRTFRTPGGHRRFLKDDLHALIQPEVPRVEDLRPLVERRSAKLLAGAPAKPLQTRPWFASLDPRLRESARERGRQLFAALVRFIAEPGARRTIRQELLEQARAYGAELHQAGVRPADAAEAFGYFRHLVLKMITDPRGRGGMLDERQVRALLDVSDLLDVVFLTMLRTWDAGRKPRRKAHSDADGRQLVEH
ncbi:MAG: helix-turn-helix domain-containing protein [Armatimonadetes bacterium]|nr:helix-turn-helix domain-containing protein [Armatimonadota bacterium]